MVVGKLVPHFFWSGKLFSFRRYKPPASRLSLPDLNPTRHPKPKPETRIPTLPALKFAAESAPGKHHSAFPTRKHSLLGAPRGGPLLRHRLRDDQAVGAQRSRPGFPAWDGLLEGLLQGLQLVSQPVNLLKCTCRVRKPIDF